MIKSYKARTLAVGAVAVLATAAATGSAHAAGAPRSPAYHAEATGIYFLTTYGDNGAAKVSAYNALDTEMSYATSYGAHGAVKVCDVLPDGYGASVQYERVHSTGPATVWDENGAGADSCVSSSDIESNPVLRYRACVDVPGPDVCNVIWTYTGAV